MTAARAVARAPGPGDDLADRGAAAVGALTALEPRAAIVLGSGLGPAVDGMEVEAEVPYDRLPGFPPAAVPGHAGRLRLGRLGGVPAAAFLGRVHFYEGHPMSLVTLPTRLAAALGARAIVVTAAVGALDGDLRPGTMVVGADHINFLGENPLRGWRDAEGRPVFVDMNRPYDADLSRVAEAAGGEAGLAVARGVYAAMPGPTYETPAEQDFLRRSGATVVGMSVVPEAAAAAALGLRCVGLFCVTNVVGEAVTHEDVTRVAAGFSEPLGSVLERVLERVPAPA